MKPHHGMGLAVMASGLLLQGCAATQTVSAPAPAPTPEASLVECAKLLPANGEYALDIQSAINTRVSPPDVAGQFDIRGDTISDEASREQVAPFAACVGRLLKGSSV